MKKDFIVRRSITMVDSKPHVETYSEQELVRCKDCKHWEQSNGHCPFNSIFTNADWFCADGERRGDSG